MESRPSTSGATTALAPQTRFVWSRAVAVWLVIIATEFVHGVVRTLVLTPVVGDLRARQIGVVFGSALVVGIALFFSRWLHTVSTATSLRVGALWVALTVAFELGFGRYVAGLSWERLVSDYNIVDGGFLPLGLLVMGGAPLMAARLRMSSSLDPLAHAKRLVRIVVGFTLLGIGVLLLVLPGPGWLTIVLGLGALASEFAWARRLLDRLKNSAGRLRDAAFGSKGQNGPSPPR